MAPPEAAHPDWLEVFDRLDLGVFTVDHVAQRVVRANEAYARILGFPSAKEAVGRSLLEHYADPTERKEIAARLLANETFRKTGVVRLEARRLRHDTREPVDVLMAIYATFAPDGQLVRMDCTLEDIGDRKRAEKAFQASEERFRALFDLADVGMVLTDRQWNIQRVNAALCRFLGRSEAELLGRDALSLVHEEDRPARPPPGDMTPLRDAGRDRRFPRPDGEAAWGYVTWSWLHDGDGAPHSGFAVVHDVTERKRLEQSLLRLAKLESLGVLAGGIAHDFNNILAAILGNVSMAARLPDAGPRTRELLALAEAECLRAGDLAQQLVTFGKGSAPRKQTGSLADVVREAAGFYLRGSNVAAEVELADDLWAADFDAGQMGQVMQNLLLNAKQAMPGGGTVRVEAANATVGAAQGLPLPPGRYVCIRVVDEGVGIPPENLGRIFDPYFSTKKTGSGLGLAMAHSIVMKHAGHIAVESKVGRGTKFEVYLPASAAEPVARPAEPQPAPELTRTRVLVMDDEPGVRDVAARILRERGLEVDVVTKGEEALEAYEAGLREGRGYGVVLLDLTIRGGLGGAETLRQLRARDPGVRAIVMTGYSADLAEASVGNGGFAAAVKKPFTAGELEKVVGAVATRAP